MPRTGKIVGAALVLALLGTALAAPPRAELPRRSPSATPYMTALRAPREPAAGMSSPVLPHHALAPLEQEATVVDWPALSSFATYPTLRADGRPAEPARWRVITNTGNCCENYLATTPSGRIFDFGSTYLVFSDDDGKTWHQVRPARTAAANGGEGSVALAPNGDVVGVTWIPYGGDRVETFKWDAEDERWYYSYLAVRHPFYDRESVAVIPGPIEHLGETYPYMVVMRGGWPTKNPWYYSFDGLNYFRPDHRAVDSATRPEKRGWLDVRPDADLDWVQPALQTTITPLGRGRALAKPDGYLGGSERFDALDRDDLGWSPFALRKGDLPSGLDTKLVADSTGRLSYVYMTRKEAVLRLSTDGGRTWRDHVIPMPRPRMRAYSVHGIQEEFELFEPSPRFEMVANGRLGILALSMQLHDPKRNLHTNYVYKYALKGARARLQRIYQLGRGDLEFGDDVTASGARMDFQSVALLPDGRIVASFGDKAHSSPAVAVEQ